MASPIPFDEQYLRFLAAEEGATDRLRNMYAQASSELQAFMLDPPIGVSASDQAFYGALQAEVDRLATATQGGATAWIEQSIPTAFVEGALQHSPDIAFSAIHDNAVKALSGYDLGLITRMADDMRSVIRQQIGVGLLEGATRQQVSDRIIRSGLTNIPHWRSLEERAAVIARTEIMRSYNAGNLAGIIDTGASAVRWITGQDEFVCGICGPRHGKRFRLASYRGDDPRVLKLPVLDQPPAHPRCRCTIRAFFGEDDESVRPQPVPGGIIDTTPTPDATPSAAATFDGMLTKARGGSFDRDMEDYFRSMAFDDDQLRAIAATGNDTVGFFVSARYKVSLDLRSAGVGFDADEAANLLIAFERINRVLPEYMLSDALSTVRIVTKLNALGDMSPLSTATGGQMRLNITSLKARLGESKLPGMQETFTHEFGHALAYKLGQIMPARFAQAPLANQQNVLFRDKWLLWRTIHTKGVTNSGVWRGEDAIASLRGSLKRLDDDIARLTAEVARPLTAEWTERDRRISDSLLFLRTKHRRDTEVQIAKIEKARAKTGTAEHYPTEYAQSGQWGEDFADSFRLYVLNPEQLQRSSPVRYAFMQKLLEGRKWN